MFKSLSSSNPNLMLICYKMNPAYNQIHFLKSLFSLPFLSPFPSHSPLFSQSLVLLHFDFVFAFFLVFSLFFVLFVCLLLFIYFWCAWFFLNWLLSIFLGRGCQRVRRTSAISTFLVVGKAPEPYIPSKSATDTFGGSTIGKYLLIHMSKIPKLWYSFWGISFTVWTHLLIYPFIFGWIHTDTWLMA